MTPAYTVHGQPSWRLAHDTVEAFVTETGGHLGPVTFRLGDRTIQPYHVAPWATEQTAALPPILKVLRGDFFCAPFGGNAEPFEGERHPPHGETANATWVFDRLEQTDDRTTLHLSLDTAVRPGRVTKTVTLVDGHAALYQRHTLDGMTGPMSFGHHAMLRFPDREESGLVSTSDFAWGQTSPRPVEVPAQRGYSLLEPGARFESLDAVPTLRGTTADLSRYPARRGYEDLVLLAAPPEATFGWTAVAFPQEGYVWFTLKDPRVLRQTILWISNGGRHYAPWNGRHVNVLGLEEVTSYFHFGLAESAAANPVSEAGFPTSVVLDGEPFPISCITGIAPIPPYFDHVATIDPHASRDAVTLTARSGRSVEVPIDVAFLAEADSSMS
ncbi:MAG: hypothetical protein AAGG50_00760 [Bacteroidota bacterium]